ncbi:bi-domain-containing oxidoreductase [Paremcibacter congregatus]|uniref:Dehydrogenase n=1 Tax=Paremcibacter congregatus TaxID=2043170 RepID=A0A2G4YRA3_9PROT|nr:bi-domain-containing oxidoreductase [Paremcibacter congregatus]PHZ84838.1 dehydrogenase [Paremcibacter congregatus]QDE26189.1 zinc-binding dehydrogenase [Paremcibacter congregatus]
MKQVLQDLAKGTSIIADVPRPRCKKGHVLIQTAQSLISAGTERMLVDFGRSSYIEKARQQPEKVKMVLDKVKADGLLPTIDAVKSKLNQPLPMGYSNVGTVIEIGTGVSNFKIGDRVLSNGHHAEVVCVPKNLCAKIPDTVSDEEAVFTVVGAIGLQGIRLANPTLGECFIVTGLGLIGLMVVQILRANGCRVLGLDFDPAKLELARQYGAETVNLAEIQDPISTADAFSRGRGVDGVIITASTKSNEPMHQAATMCRKKGRVVLVGVVGLELQRSDFFEKEISFHVSCSYGPGRYDSSYEDHGNDYPVGYVRWTEQRNFEAILDMMAIGAIDTDDLRTKTFEIENAPKAYDLLMAEKGALGVLLSYKADIKASATRTLAIGENTSNTSEQVIIGAIGAGNYAGRILLPAFKRTGARLKTIATSQGVSGTHHGKKLGFEFNTTNSNEMLADREVNTIVIGTQHSTHSHFVEQALAAGKNVFVEKPLALTNKQLDKIDEAYRAAYDRGENPKLMVGFNRRYAPLMQKLKKQVEKSTDPMSIMYTCNAGAIPADTWVQDSEAGGGRIIGEACHFIDIVRFLCGCPIVDIQAASMKMPEGVTDCHDTASIMLRFKNGSLATIHYFANGHQSFPKERIEVFQNGNIMILNNFRRLTGFGNKSINCKTFKQNKGQQECCNNFVESLRNGENTPIPYEEIMEVSRVAIKAWDQLLVQ